MKRNIKKIVAMALAELGDIEFVKAVENRFAKSEDIERPEPLKASVFAVLAKL
jgi:hypothetical protein